MIIANNGEQYGSFDTFKTRVELIENPKKYKASDIVEGLEDLKHSEIAKIIKETEKLAIPNDKEENIKKEGQTQADE